MTDLRALLDETYKCEAVLREEVARLRNLLAAVEAAYGDRTWGTVEAMGRLMPDIRRILTGRM